MYKRTVAKEKANKILLVVLKYRPQITFNNYLIIDFVINKGNG